MMHKSLLSVIMARGGNHNVIGIRFTEETDLLLCVFLIEFGQAA